MIFRMINETHFAAEAVLLSRGDLLCAILVLRGYRKSLFANIRG